MKHRATLPKGSPRLANDQPPFFEQGLILARLLSAILHFIPSNLYSNGRMPVSVPLRVCQKCRESAYVVGLAKGGVIPNNISM
jgi:hypothetical protein